MTTKEIKERTADEAAAAAPFTIPSGSFDMEELLAAGNKAADASPEKRQEILDEGIDAANQKIHGTLPPGLEPGFRYQSVKREDLGVTEVIQVRGKAESKAIEKDEAEAEKARLAAEQAAEAEAERLNAAADAVDEIAVGLLRPGLLSFKLVAQLDHLFIGVGFTVLRLQHLHLACRALHFFQCVDADAV